MTDVSLGVRDVMDMTLDVVGATVTFCGATETSANMESPPGDSPVKTILKELSRPENFVSSSCRCPVICQPEDLHTGDPSVVQDP